MGHQDIRQGCQSCKDTEFEIQPTSCQEAAIRKGYFNEAIQLAKGFLLDLHPFLHPVRNMSSANTPRVNSLHPQKKRYTPGQLGSPDRTKTNKKDKHKDSISFLHFACGTHSDQALYLVAVCPVAMCVLGTRNEQKCTRVRVRFCFRFIFANIVSMNTKRNQKRN